MALSKTPTGLLALLAALLVPSPALVCTAALLTGCGGDGHPAAVPPCSGAIGYQDQEKHPLHAPLENADWPVSDAGDWIQRSLTAELSDALDARLAEILDKSGAPAISAALAVPGVGRWSRTRGWARATPPVAVDDASLFWWASVGKAYTAALVLGIAAEGGFGLDATLDRWRPAFPEARHITLEHLLRHTSGIRDFNEDGFAAQIPRDEYRSPEELIAVVQRSKNLFCPGGYWSYSNTGYVLLGSIVEETQQKTYARLVEQRLIAPLHLAHTAVIEPNRLPPGLVTGHLGGQPREDDASVAKPFAAGAIASRAEDVVLFWNALLTGRILSEATIRASFSPLYPMFGQTDQYYGLGVMVIDWKDSQRRSRRWLGHLGGGLGHNAMVAYDPWIRVYVAVAVNSEVSAVAVANALLETLEHAKP